ncbi:MAG: class I SAM-dependent methyltransferase [Tepidiformaceae bacterium]
MALDLDPGRTAVGNPRLVDAIREEMAGGAMPFERFMELALYHPEHGYYRKPGRIGTGGDFLTSPAIHPMFGWAVGGWCQWVWEQAGRPPEFAIIEPGAGEGRLAAAILDWAAGRDDGFGKAIRYVAIEPHNAGDDERVEWRTTLPEPVEHGVVVANELFDAFPVRLFEAGPRGPVEVHVRWDEEEARFVEAPGAVWTIEGAPDAGRFELNPRAYPAMEQLCGLVARGAVLVFDYGYPQEELWAPWRTQGTLLCFYRHTAHEDPLIHVGEQDITSHVNLSELAGAAEEAGMRVSGPIPQSEFLWALGLGQLVDAARGDMNEYFTRRRALTQLTDGAGLGRIRVLAATRGIDGVPPGFEASE